MRIVCLSPIILAALVTGCGAPTATPSSSGALFVARQQAGSNYHTLYGFKGKPDGDTPESPLLYMNGNLYGTTVYGGANNAGTVYGITPAGIENVLYGFYSNKPDGILPISGLTNVNGTLYGTTANSSESSNPYCGTVFSVTLTGSEKVLYYFNNGTDACYPAFGTLLSVKTALYGTTANGGSSGTGAIFRVAITGGETRVYSFGNGNFDGASPEYGLLDVGGTYYGTTELGGGTGSGVVYSLSAGKITTLHSFGYGKDGAYAYSDLIDIGGTLYGTTSEGGSSGNGAVYKITTKGTESVLYSFPSGNGGCTPQGNLVYVKGALYGTASACGAHSYGVLYKLTLAGTETIVHAFGSNSGDGLTPMAGLTNADGTLYGTTSAGGPNNRGTVYTLGP